MAMDQAQLGDTKRLRLLAETVAGLPGRITKAVEDIEQDAAPRLRRIERAAENARQELRAAEAVYNSLSEDDDEAAARWAIAEAQERLARISRAIDQVQASLRRYKLSARALSDAKRGLLAGAAVYLTERIDAADRYLALQVHSQGAVSASSNGGTAAGTQQGADLTLMTGVQLPEGFSWIPIDLIIERDLDGSSLEWKKGVSRQDMKVGLTAFRNDMLPTLAGGGNISREDFVDLDRSLDRVSRGAIEPNSLAHLYDVFFGVNSIAVDHDPAGGLSITNGRHRISVARELGWTHIPGRILGKGMP